ncbi:acetyl-CoA/propionyl-CoA carboxylase biotin carboxyl carrier protein [Microbacterium sp. AK009]|uniref:acetyl/propionyl/methylcrotonyl-CoA carboxylase subunit alpha n=1 Tax=Microbacterium sp. AK009 TaxID=2723068 RepID=UPI0015C6B70C|nr:biotin carboxylase N-terminal domain-containing protein [Microbacterium sp. AK009]NYF16207.1 acetyl-CoA/propionyl-CoA carboxylase biotin carboxyl carrier protein [Microbacterium sp. AK009]
MTTDHPAPIFRTVLVANRGEIARRVIRTLRVLGIRAVAVYSDADADAPHVREADVAVRIGPAAASASYLDVDAVIDAARRSGAEAIHPGYGFLSENVAFARACAAAGIVFIGPGERALEVMGDKIRAKEHVAGFGVPTVPGFSAAGMDDAEIARSAQETGFPLLVKPSAGGGGKGMQIVRAAGDLSAAVESARRVARAAFGDDTLLLERLVERPRHIEVQVLADDHGHVVHLGERECTLQRRHQKVIEEAPSPAIDPTTRERLGRAACAAAASVDYRGAGTVEFLVAASRPEEFFFIEMNTRLQVEHPVTEEVTGIDLVAEQLRIAAGLPLSVAQDEVRMRGHAIEARVYAESPERGFVPSVGEILAWRPAPGIRTDAAIEAGSVVTADYDPMIAKVIAHAADRAAALKALDEALAATVIAGVETNVGFLRALLSREDVRAGELDTGIIDRMPELEPSAPDDVELAAAAAVVETASDGAPGAHSRHGAGPVWRSLRGWRGGRAPVSETVSFVVDGIGVVSAQRSDTVPAPEVVVARADDGAVWTWRDGVTHRLMPIDRREAMTRRLAAQSRPVSASAPQVRAPMPGAVVAVHASDGARVASGDRLVSIEAMKMEHIVIAPHDGAVRIHVAIGDQVNRDQIVAEVEEDQDDHSAE